MSYCLKSFWQFVSQIWNFLENLLLFWDCLMRKPTPELISVQAKKKRTWGKPEEEDLQPSSSLLDLIPH